MKFRFLFLLPLLSAIWGISFLLIRIAGEAFPPLWVALLRTGFGAGLLWTVLILGKFSLPPRRLWPWLLLVALFNNAIPFTFFAWGEQTVPSSTAAILNATTPIWALLLSIPAQSLRVTTTTVAGVLIGFFGVVLVVSGEAQQQGTNRGSLLTGVLIIAIASLCYAIATVMAKVKLKGLDPIGLATTQLSLAGLMLLPVALAGTHPTAPSAKAIAAILTLGLAGSGLAYLIYYSLLAHISATHVAAVTYLLPLWGVFWGGMAGEVIGWTAYVGVVVVIAGLILLNLRSSQQASDASSQRTGRQQLECETE
jgi:drug/metabolite transporter (DMT)-like permease